jgi:hypothetical protein
MENSETNALKVPLELEDSQSSDDNEFIFDFIWNHKEPVFHGKKARKGLFSIKVDTDLRVNVSTLPSFNLQRIIKRDL